MRVRIEPARPEDVDFIKELEIKSGLSSWSREDYLNEIFENNPLFLVAKSGAVNLGFIVARLIMNYESDHSEYPFESEMEIHNLAVESDFRRNGIASGLIDKAIKLTTGRNLGKIHLEVRKSNKSATRFYQKNRFEIIGERKNFYTNPVEDAILMCRFPAQEDSA